MTVDRDQQIRDLYEAALRQRVADRAGFVAAGARGDTELQHVVELLLVRGVATTVGAADAGVPALCAGTHIGQYRIEGLLGAGGMGVVYRATCTKLNRPAAIKFLSPHLADADARRRFQSEAQTASSLNHPHIVTVYDTGDYQDRQYLITEFVDGGTFRQWAAQNARWRQIVEMLVGVADGLAAAHEAQSCIATSSRRTSWWRQRLCQARGFRVGEARARGRFGTRAIPGPYEDRSRHRHDRLHVAGASVRAGARCTQRHLFLGVVLYELLTGRRPFGGASDYDRLRRSWK